MSGFYLYSGNRQEQLLEALARVVRQPLRHPLQSEYVVVQHHGMQRWVSMRLAEKNGIEANTRFLFSNGLLNLAFEQSIPHYQPSETLEPDHLAWMLLEILQNQKNDPQWEPLSHYLQESNPLKVWQLAKRIAYLFDQYSMFRPEMMLQWDAGASDGWQAALWRAMPVALRRRYKPFLRKAFLEQVASSFQKETDFPERISVFGISSLPPLHVEVLEALSHFTNIHFFYLTPTEIVQEPRKQEMPGFDQENALLASLGQYGRDFLLLMRARGILKEQEQGKSSREALFLLPEGNSLLEQIQQDIFKHSSPVEMTGVKGEMAPEDASIRIHACHGPMREVEVLHDQLLRMMDQDPQLKPSDILVMTPEIDEYVPLIQSVFSSEVKGRTFPFSIADRGSRQESRVVQYLFRLLNMGTSRFTVTEVLDLLESEAIRARFGLNQADMELLRNWIGGVNIRWGVDEDFRVLRETPRTRENTWHFGIDRLLTGYAMPGKDEILFEDILPFDDIEGSDALVLGRFLEFFENLTSLIGKGEFSLKEERTLKEWARYLRQLITVFFEKENEWEEELNVLWQCGEELAKLQETAQLTIKIEVEVFASYLEEKLDQALKKTGFLGDGTTFCSMLPMRSIPFKVIALLGMNDSAFPRIMTPLSIDLMSRKKQLGDRLLKEEDRQLFLETLLCCRKVLYISYIAHEIRDNTALPPSSVVNELIQYIEQNYHLKKERLVVHHKLQAFHPDYFRKNDLLFSYSEDNWKAAKALKGQGSRVVPKFEIQLSEPDLASAPESEKPLLEVDLEKLLSFFGNPARFLLTQRLAVRLGEAEELPEDEEPFSLDPLSKYLLQSEQLEYILNDRKTGQLRKIVKARGDLPLGNAGDYAWEAINKESYQFAKPLRDYLEASPLDPFEYDFRLAGVRLRGIIRDIRSNGLVRYRPARIKVKDRLQIWLEQLLLNLHSPAAYPRKATLIGKGPRNQVIERYTSLHIETPQPYLAELLGFYKKGLQEPLAFFPESANEYMKEWVKGNRDKAREKARGQWNSGEYGQGEKEKNPYFKRCFEHLDLIEEMDFEENTVRILDPVFAHQKEE